MSDSLKVHNLFLKTEEKKKKCMSLAGNFLVLYILILTFGCLFNVTSSKMLFKVILTLKCNVGGKPWTWF